MASELTNSNLVSQSSCPSPCHRSDLTKTSSTPPHLLANTALTPCDALLGVKIDSERNVVVITRPEAAYLRLCRYSPSLQYLSSSSIRLDVRLASVPFLPTLDAADGVDLFHVAFYAKGYDGIDLHTFSTDGEAKTPVSLMIPPIAFHSVDGVAVSKKTGMIFAILLRQLPLGTTGSVAIWTKEGTYQQILKLADNPGRSRRGHRPTALVLIENEEEEWLYVLDRGTRGLEVYNVTTHAFMFFIGGHPESNAPLQRSHGLTEAVLPSTGQLFFTTFVLDPNDDHVYIYDEERTRWLEESLRVRGGRAGCSQPGVSRLIVMVDEVASPHRGRLVVLEKGAERDEDTERHSSDCL